MVALVARVAGVVAEFGKMVASTSVVGAGVDVL